ncbi:DUF5723 family protein [Algoriphagus zhangzhouensis]|uniref:DUF5723 domain-containing protein n=1 Tax=Algoriphagus zhangzhouensis TaxID=1073327 RepID=A0A1M7ZGR1_9BACT|nr:DUF5723 family protein [Algoriphagus zhangzhouensis]TDY44645.1 hypothetical protein A8938_2852 [Algoriphagus zhangzhouensis]SHO64063.1 hypothetical protein SAMN04488108_3233 [Algoriphagus zhangzhouensis]
MLSYLKRGLLFAILVLSTTISYAQSFIGGTMGGRTGVHYLLTNPAGITGSKMKLDVNLLSVSAIISNDYVGINLAELDKFDEGFFSDDNLSTTPSEQNNFLGNVDFLGPSVLLNLNERNSVALSTRFRTYFNLNNIGGDFYQVISNEDAEVENFDLSMEDLQGLLHAWGEIGASYGRVLMENEDHILRGGITLKYLMGAGGVYGSSNILGAGYSSSNDIISTSGSLQYGYTSGFDSEDVNFSDPSSGFGADLGLIFEIRETDYSDSYTMNDHKLRFGLSVMDIGSINYKASRRFTYNTTASIHVDEFLDKDLEQVLEDNYEGSEFTEDKRFGLPTSLQIFADYHISSLFYVNLQVSLSIKDHGEIPVSKMMNQLTITPRFETRWLSVYSPVSFREYSSGVYWGLGVRVGPLMVGSGSIITNLISKNSQSADAYIGLKVPIYRRD